MKRLALVTLILTVLGAAIAYWHITSQVDDRLNALSGQLSPIGQLTWSTIRLDPRGRVTIDGIDFRPHDHRDRLRIERLTVDVGHLAALVQLDRMIDSRRWPSELIVNAAGLYLPVNPKVDAWTRAILPPQHWISAGCPEIDPFRFFAFAELGVWELTGRARFAYRYREEKRILELSAHVGFDRLVDLDLTTQLQLDAQDLRSRQPFIQRAALDRARITVGNRGLLGRLSDFCSKRTGLTPEQFRTLHVRSWEGDWQERGLQPGHLVLAGYRHFLEHPKTLRLDFDPEPAVELTDLPMRLGNEELDAAFSVNDGTPVDLRVDRIAPIRSRTVLSPPPDSPGSEPVEESSVVSVPEPPLTIPGRTFGPAPQWQVIEPNRAEEFIGGRIRLELADGSSYSGRLVGVDDEHLHLSIRNRLGQFVRPLPRAEMTRVEIRP